MTGPDMASRKPLGVPCIWTRRVLDRAPIDVDLIPAANLGLEVECFRYQKTILAESWATSSWDATLTRGHTMNITPNDTENICRTVLRCSRMAAVASYWVRETGRRRRGRGSAINRRRVYRLLIGTHGAGPDVLDSGSGSICIILSLGEVAGDVSWARRASIEDKRATKAAFSDWSWDKADATPALE